MNAIRIMQSAAVLIAFCSTAKGTEAQGEARACLRPAACPSDVQLRALQDNCSRNLIYEATVHCKVVCPKQLGDTCGGRCGQEGICIDDGSALDEGVKCSVSIGNLAADSNMTDVGRCVRRCRLNYTLAETGVCVPQCQQDYILDSNGTCIHKICLKNCSAEEISNVCGSDGRWYMNSCDLQQQKLCRNRNVVRSNESSCNSACTELTPPDNGNVALSNELISGSVANVTCNDGFMLDRVVKPVCRGSILGWSPAPPSCIRPPCSNHWCNTARYKCAHMVDESSYVVARCVCKTASDCDTSSVSEATLVCGSDKNTYLNSCLLYVTACSLPNPSNLTLQYRGRCRSKRAPRRSALALLRSRARRS